MNARCAVAEGSRRVNCDYVPPHTNPFTDARYRIGGGRGRGGTCTLDAASASP